MAWVVEITGTEIGVGAKTLRFAMGAGIAFTDAAYAPSGFEKWVSPSQKIDVSKTGSVEIAWDEGEVQINNLPDKVTQAGPLDALAEYAWQNGAATLYWIPGTTWAARVKVAFGVLEQVGANLAAKGEVTSVLRFGLRDPRKVLETPMQPVKYLGNNVGAAGVEGAADLKGKPKPILYGVASNISGVQVNQSKLVWQIADKSVAVLCVRDGGLTIPRSTVRASLASMLASDPAPGTHDFYAGAEGTFVRLGTRPVAVLTFDAQEGANAAARTHAQIWSRIRTERCGNVAGDLLTASITATDALDANEVGWWWDGEKTRKEAINQVLASLSGYEVLGFDGKWAVARLVAPTGATKIDIVPLSDTSALKVKNRKLTSLDRVRPSFAPDGSPPYRVNVLWGFNNTLMSESSFNGAASERLRNKFGEAWRTETATNLAIWNPTTAIGPWPQAPELTVETGYQPGVDGLTCPHAATEAARLLALYSSMKAQYQVGFIPDPSDQILPGDVVSLAYPQMGLAAGPLFRVLQAGFVLDGNRVRTNLVIGLQT